MTASGTMTSDLRPAIGERWPKGLLAAGAFVSCALFVAAVPLRLLYHSNQNTKFLHGLAAAYPERLGNDWTAQTADGLPAFSFLVQLIARYSHPLAFYLLEVGLLSVLFISLVLIARKASPARDSLAFLVTVAAFLTFLASTKESLLRGVALQYLSDGYLQPSEFGVLYLTALLMASAGKRGGVMLAAVPALFHPAYLAFSVILCPLIVWHGRRTGSGQSVVEIVLAGAMVMLPAIDLAVRFAPTDADTFARASEIIAFERIRHHSAPSSWLDARAWSKLALAIVAIAVASPGIIRASLTLLLVYAVVGTLVVAVSNNPQLALIAPWRASVLIVPISGALVTGAVVGLVLDRVPLRPVRWVMPLLASVLAVAAAMSGIEEKVKRIARAKLPDHVAHVRNTARPGNEYLTRIEEDSFRLEAMAPQFVTWKTHPYRDTEVMVWFQRMELARAVFGEERRDQPTGFDCGALEVLLGVARPSHVVVEADDPSRSDAVGCPLLEIDFEGKHGSVFAVRGPSRTGTTDQSERRALRAAPMVPSSR